MPRRPPRFTARSLAAFAVPILALSSLVGCAEGEDEPLGGPSASGGSGSGDRELELIRPPVADEERRGGWGGSSGIEPWSRPGDPCFDACPVPGGLAVGCKRRFMYGLNYAWRSFGTDFGGHTAWSQPGVAARPNAYGNDLFTLRQAGVSTVRWWMLPDFRGDGVRFDPEGAPLGLGGTLLEDLEAALALAEATDVYLMLTLFSFDGFRASTPDGSATHASLSPIARDPELRLALVETVIRPIAEAAESSPFRHRLIEWDVINEPEWVITDTNPYGDPPYTPTAGFDPVTHAEMEALIAETVTALHEASTVPVTVGSAAMKWRAAWSQVGLDFYQFHTYDWIERYWPYDQPPAEYGLDDRPVVMGEFPIQGLANASYAELLGAYYDHGYAGALAWSFNDPNFPFAENAPEVAAFAAAYPCETDWSQ